jgi:hypothetical protein
MYTYNAHTTLPLHDADAMLALIDEPAVEQALATLGALMHVPADILACPYATWGWLQEELWACDIANA